MSIGIRVWVMVAALLAVTSAYGQQTSAMRGARATPAAAAPVAPPSEGAIKEMINAGRAVEVARLLEEHARRAPGNKALRARVAQVYESQGDLTAAKTAAVEAATGDSPSVEALAVLGRIAAREGDWANAAVHWRNVINATPNDAAAHLDYANALEHIGDATGADNEYATYRALQGMKPIARDAAKK